MSATAFRSALPGTTGLVGTLGYLSLAPCSCSQAPLYRPSMRSTNFMLRPNEPVTLGS
jgi:hypothetical protein